MKPDNGKQEVFGIVRASAHTLVDKSTRLMTLFNFGLLQIDFPTLADHGQQYYAVREFDVFVEELDVAVIDAMDGVEAAAAAHPRLCHPR